MGRQPTSICQPYSAIGAVGVGEARTAVLSGHQWPRPFILGARGARFVGGMVDEGSEGKKAREMSSFLAPDNST